MKKSFIFLGAFLLLSGWVIRDNVFAYSPVDLYDNVWRLINSKFVDQTNNQQNWAKWRHKYDNQITNKEEVISNFEKLIALQLEENSPKSWFRAFFNNGLINYIEGNRRMLPCEAGLVNFFVDPYGDVYPCNGLEEQFWKESMGNIRSANHFNEIWESEQAERVRSLVRKCPKNCWMVGTASPVMKKYIQHPLGWVIKNKLNSMLNKPLNLERKWYNVGQDPDQGNLQKTK